MFIIVSQPKLAKLSRLLLQIRMCLPICLANAYLCDTELNMVHNYEVWDVQNVKTLHYPICILLYSDHNECTELFTVHNDLPSNLYDVTVCQWTDGKEKWSSHFSAI